MLPSPLSLISARVASSRLKRKEKGVFPLAFSSILICLLFSSLLPPPDVCDSITISFHFFFPSLT